MPEVVIAKPREGKFNKNAARRVRVAGKIPAVLYGPGTSPVAVEVDPKQISRILFSETGHNTIFDVEIAGLPAAKAMIVDWQREPIKDQLIHIDLKRIALDKPSASRCASSCWAFRWASRPLAAFWTRCCARSKSSACPPTFPATSTWTSAAWSCTACCASAICLTPKAIKYLNSEDATVAHVVSIREEAPTAAELEAAAAPRQQRSCRSGRARSGQEGQAGS
jgi:large subunit ribosomal protein L25